METTKPLFDLATVRCPHVLLTASLFDIVDIYIVDGCCLNLYDKIKSVIIAPVK